MNIPPINWRWPTAQMRFSTVQVVSVVLVAIGLLLGVTVHMGFMALFAAGAVRPRNITPVPHAR